MINTTVVISTYTSAMKLLTTEAINMETKTKYLVTSATGNTGYQVALQLLEKGENVRVMSRKYGKKIAQLESMGAEVTLGHLANEADMRSAVSGVQRVYYCHPIFAGLLHNTVMFARIAREEGIEAVVNIGQYLSELDSHPSRTTNEHKMAYDVLDNAGIGAIHVTPGWFADNIFETSLFNEFVEYLKPAPTVISKWQQQT